MIDRDWQRIVRVAEAFEQTQVQLWSSMWPFGHCAVSSLLLAPLLRCADTAGGWRIAVGVVAPTRNGAIRPEYAIWGNNSSSDREPLRHAWCESADGHVIDSTYGQFDGCEALVVLRPHEAGDLGHFVYRKMTLDEEEQARRSITPTNRDGWTATSIVKLWFEEIEYL